MNEWIDGCMDKWIGGWNDFWMDGCIKLILDISNAAQKISLSDKSVCVLQWRWSKVKSTTR